MNLREAKDVVHKIRELLTSGRHKAQGPILAKDYERFCHDTSERLEQCARMVESRKFNDAVQFANQSPTVMECIAVLRFEKSEDWVTHCESNGWPLATRFDEDSIRALKHAMEQADEIGPTHPLSKKYTQERIKGNLNQAYDILRTILEMDPDNSAAREAKPELERGILQRKSEAIQNALRQSDVVKVVALIEEVESLSFFVPEHLECWPKAKACQVDLWLKEVSAHMKNEDWQTSAHLLDKVQQAKEQIAGLTLDGRQENFIEKAGEWTGSQEADWLREEEFREAVRTLEIILSNRENDRSRNVSPSLGELREVKKELDECWIQLQTLEKPIPGELQARGERERAALTGDIQQKEGGGARMIILAIAACLMLCAFIVVCIVSYNSGSELRASLKGAIGERRVSAIKAGLAGIKLLGLKHLLVAGLKETMGEAHVLVAQEEKLNQDVSTYVDGLYKKRENDFNGTDPDQDQDIESFRDQLLEGTNQVASLAPEFKPELEHKLDAIQVSFNLKVLGVAEKLRAKRYDDLLKEMEALQTMKLQFGQGPQLVRDGLQGLVPIITQWRQKTNTSIPSLAPGVVHQQRLKTIELAQKQYQDLLDEWDAADKQAQAAGTGANLTKIRLSDYLAALEKLRSNKLTRQVIMDELKTIAGFNIDLDNLLKQKITPSQFKGDPDFLDKLKGPLRLRPTASDIDSITHWNDKFIAEEHVNCDVVRLYRLPINEAEIENPPLLYSGLEGFGRYPDYDILYLKDGQPQFVFGALPMGKGFEMHSKLQGNQNKVAFKKNVQVPPIKGNAKIIQDKKLSGYMGQKSMITRSGIDKLWDRDQTPPVWGEDALACLDYLNQFVKKDVETGISVKYLADPNTGQLKDFRFLRRYNPRFVAYLASNLYKLMDMQKGEWGLEWSARARKDREVLKKLKADRIDSGDWMVKGLETEEDNTRLQNHFYYAATRSGGNPDSGRAQISYVEEAKAYHRLLSSAYDNGNGIRFLGYQKPDTVGPPDWLRGVDMGREIFGYSIDGFHRLYVRDESGDYQIAPGAAANALDYSPLFGLAHDRAKLLNKFNNEMKAGDYKDHLPPLFSGVNTN